MAITVKLKDGTTMPVNKALLAKLLATGNVVDIQGQEEGVKEDIFVKPENAPKSLMEPQEPSQGYIQQSYDKGYTPKSEYENLQGAIGSLRKPLAMSLTGYESIPSAISAIDIKNPLNKENEFPYIQLHPEQSATIEQDVADRYKQILEKPNFLEDVLTDPVTYIPGIGAEAKLAKYAKYAKTAPKLAEKASKYANIAKYTEPVVNAAIQTGGEMAQGKLEPTVGNAIVAGGVGTVAGTGASLVAPKISKYLKEGAVSSLGKKLGLKPSSQAYPQGTDVEMLFVDKQIPVTGGREGIYNQLASTVKGVGEERDVILGEMRDKYNKMLEGYNKQLAQHEALYPNLTDEQAGAVTDLELINKGKKPSHIISSDDLARTEELASPFTEWRAKTPIEPADEFTLAPAGKLYENAVRIYNEATAGRALTADEKAKILATIKKEIIDFEDPSTGRATLTDLIKRRQQWADKGKVGTKAYDELTSTQAKAYALLSQAGSSTLNAIPDVAKQNKKFARYLPTLQAMEEKIPAWTNQRSRISDIPVRFWESNPALLARYGAGEATPTALEVAKSFAIPSVASYNPSDRYKR